MLKDIENIKIETLFAPHVLGEKKNNFKLLSQDRICICVMCIQVHMSLKDK